MSNSVKHSNGTTIENSQKQQIIYDIEWYMLDKSKYYPYTIISSLAVRSLLYPIALVRTRLQIQIQNSVYRGTWDALKTIYNLEGFTALYRSFLFYNLHIIPNFIYIITFERIRQHLAEYKALNNTYTRAMIAGGSSSLISQGLTVPIDVIVQHMMLVGQKASKNAQNRLTVGTNSKIYNVERIHLSADARKSNIRMFKEICSQIYKNDKFFGFYRGYFLSTSLMSMNSALWWPFYYFYQDNLKNIFPSSLPPIALQCMCAPLSSLTSSTITNPLDVIRARMQITKQKQSIINVTKTLWEQEGFNIFFKGLTARLSYSALYSFFVMLGYETVKRHSLKQEYHTMFIEK